MVEHLSAHAPISRSALTVVLSIKVSEFEDRLPEHLESCFVTCGRSSGVQTMIVWLLLYLNFFDLSVVDWMDVGGSMALNFLVFSPTGSKELDLTFYSATKTLITRVSAPATSAVISSLLHHNFIDLSPSPEAASPALHYALSLHLAS